MNLIFDSRNEIFKKPFGCVPFGEEMAVTVYCDVSCAELFLSLAADGEEEKLIEMKKTGEANGYGVYSVSFAFASCGLYFYRFCVIENGEKTFFGRNGKGAPDKEADNRWQVTCYDKKENGRADFSGRVYYQIFPDRFYKYGEYDLSEKLGPFWTHDNMTDIPHYLPDERGEILNNDFYGGNLSGIIKKLDYLAELGVEVIYLNPIFMAYSNHRYDTADYKRIDPMLGTEDDFRRLSCVAHEKGIKIVLDGVFSHTGDRSVYFDKHCHFGNGAVSNPDSPYREWYKFSDYPNDYESWWGIKTLPCVDELNPSFMDYVATGDDSVIRHWMRAGADGFRLDVADELPDEFVKAVQKTVKEENPQAVIIGEVWEDASNKISYGVRRKYFLGSELDGVMNYVYRNAIIDFVKRHISAEEFAERIMRIAENYPKEALLCSMNFLSTHDTGRILTLLAGEDGNRMTKDERAAVHLNGEQYKVGLKLLSAAVFLLFTLPGSPCIYYGDEIGMQGYEDPFNRRFFDWQGGDENVRKIYSDMSIVHRENPVLQKGDIRFGAIDDGLVSFYRKNKEEELMCAVNVSDKATELPVFCKKVIIENGCLIKDKKITLLPYGSGVFRM